MKCPYCQSEYHDGLAVCPSCAAPNTSAQQGYNNTQNAEQGYDTVNTQHYPSAIEILKQAVNTPLFLVATILFSVYCGLSFLSGSLPVLDILLTVGLWLLYSECRKNHPNPYVFSSTPLTLIKIVETIKYVVTWILTVLLALLPLLIFFIIYAISASTGGVINIGVIILVCILFFVMIVIASVPGIIMRRGFLNYAKGAADTVQTGTRPQKLSSVAPILCIVFSVIGILSCGASFFMIDLLSEYMPEMIGSISGIPSSNMSDLGELEEFMTSMVFSPAMMLPSILSSIINPIACILFSVVLLRAKGIVDNSYYPTAEQYYYEKQAYYAQHPQVNMYAAPYGQMPYAQAPYRQYGQVPPQPYGQAQPMQAPYGQPTQAPYAPPQPYGQAQVPPQVSPQPERVEYTQPQTTQPTDNNTQPPSAQ